MFPAQCGSGACKALLLVSAACTRVPRLLVPRSAAARPAVLLCGPPSLCRRACCTLPPSLLLRVGARRRQPPWHGAARRHVLRPVLRAALLPLALLSLCRGCCDSRCCASRLEERRSLSPTARRRKGWRACQDVLRPGLARCAPRHVVGCHVVLLPPLLPLPLAGHRCCARQRASTARPPRRSGQHASGVSSSCCCRRRCRCLATAAVDV